jgi:hypothetical protein
MVVGMTDFLVAGADVLSVGEVDAMTALVLLHDVISNSKVMPFLTTVPLTSPLTPGWNLTTSFPPFMETLAPLQEEIDCEVAPPEVDCTMLGRTAFRLLPGVSLEGPLNPDLKKSNSPMCSLQHVEQDLLPESGTRGRNRTDDFLRVMQAFYH